MTFKELINSKKLSGYKFAQESGIHLPAVYALINGKRDPLKMTVYSAKKASETLGITLDEFYSILKAV